MPTIGALNFVLHGRIGGGVTRTLALDVHGKSLSSALLEMEIPDEDGNANRKAIRLGESCGDSDHPALLTFALAILSAAAVHAQVTRLEIASREPFKGSQPAGEAGPYEIIRGKIHGEVDPAIRITGSFRIWSSRRATRAAGSSTSQRLRWPSRWIPLGRPALWSIRSSIAVTAHQRRARRGTSLSSVAGRETSPRPRQTRLSSSPSRGIGTDRPSPVLSSRASTTWRPARTPSLFV